jgi:hypothetical protein
VYSFSLIDWGIVSFPFVSIPNWCDATTVVWLFKCIIVPDLDKWLINSVWVDCVDSDLCLGSATKGRTCVYMAPDLRRLQTMVLYIDGQRELM